MEELKHILNVTRSHNRAARERVDLCATNAWISHFARLVLCSSLANTFPVDADAGTLPVGRAYVDMLEREVIRLLRELFGFEHALLSYASGAQANLAVYGALLARKDTIMLTPARLAGHHRYAIDGPLRHVAPKIVPVPFDAESGNVDVEALRAAIARAKPRLVVVGWGETLFPHPLSEIRAACDNVGALLVYDMSNVAGLIAGGAFQPELSAAHLATASLGRSLHGVDHGVVLFRDAALRPFLEERSGPLSSANPHPHEIGVLGVALNEAASHGRAYASQAIRNAQILGRALHDLGFNVLYAERGYTQSHMILIRISQSALAASLLERAGILVETYYLPSDAPTVPTGLRLATHIATRRGMGEPEMKELARAMAEVLLSGEHPEHVFHTRVRPLTEGLLRAAYSFDQYFPLADSWHEDPYAGFRLDSPIRILRGMPAFAGCSTTDLEEIAERLSVERFDDARGIFCAGDEADAVYFIDHGAANVLDITPSGTRHVNRLTDGHHFGELEVLLGRPRRFHVRVEPGTRLLGISAANFAAIVERLPTVQRYFKRYVELKWG